MALGESNFPDVVVHEVVSWSCILEDIAEPASTVLVKSEESSSLSICSGVLIVHSSRDCVPVGVDISVIVHISLSVAKRS